MGIPPDTTISRILRHLARHHCDLPRHTVQWDMLESFRDAWLRSFFVNDRSDKRIPADIAARLFRKLQMIDDATSDRDLRSPPSNPFEKLVGALAGRHSIRLNQQWRLIFEWDAQNGTANPLYLDNHSCR